MHQVGSRGRKKPGAMAGKLLTKERLRGGSWAAAAGLVGLDAGLDAALELPPFVGGDAFDVIGVASENGK
jgi:hypothetical protein